MFIIIFNSYILINPLFRILFTERAKYQVKGEVEMGPQYHFTMEPQSCVCSPTEDGINIFASTQWMSCIQGAVSEVLNIPENRYIKSSRLMTNGNLIVV